jgi:molecular chaperone HtpG
MVDRGCSERGIGAVQDQPLLERTSLKETHPPHRNNPDKIPCVSRQLRTRGVSMKDSPLPSRAENSAYKAQTLEPFSRFNLVGVRNSLKDLLAQIGRSDIFSQYTKHDISHIDVLLEMLNWVIPNETLKVMTPTDWMLIVLAIYFHDAGMVVTKQEFDRRNESDYPQFRDEVLSNPTPSPYQERVVALDDKEREFFLYQEFVRVHHAERIKRWVTGETRSA